MDRQSLAIYSGHRVNHSGSAYRKMSLWREFFEGDEHRGSMTRLLSFLSYFPASYVVVTHPSEGMIGWYLGAFAGAYAGGKLADALQNRKPSPAVQTGGPTNVKVTKK